ncbi:STAS domain-containing protein [Nonomuraea sp. NPDC050783]|uniref:STAS domain-containing protein n=1 Tax=Nonomuraea sp. NPDC050783 TaxID=3154634 RepID=UPI0034655287
MMQLSVRLVPVGETTLVVALTGELDSTTRPVLAAFLDPLPQSLVKYVVIAAADLWFCDLNGLEQLAATHRAMQARGGHLAVAEAKPPLRRLISLMAEQAQPAIPVYATMPEALADTDVDVYEVSKPPVPVPRHMPRLRNVRTAPLSDSVRERLRQRRQQRPGPVVLPLSLVMDQSRHLREQTLRQRYTMTRQLMEAAESCLLLVSARERCAASLAALRNNRTTIQSAVRGPATGPATGSATGPATGPATRGAPIVAPAAPATAPESSADRHTTAVLGQGKRDADTRT